jgi:predicted RNase H-like nuclease
MKLYKYTKLSKLGPVDGFLIHTPDDRKLKDTHPQTIVRELNRINVEMDEKRKDIVYLATEKAKLEERIKRLEEAGDELICYLSHHIKTDHSDPIWHSASIKWGKVKKETKL